MQAHKKLLMYKKSSSDSRNSKTGGNTFRKREDSGSGNKKPYRSADRGGDGAEGDRPRKSYGGGSSSGGFKKEGGYNKSARSGAPRDNDRAPRGEGFRAGGRPAGGERSSRPDSRPFRERDSRGPSGDAPTRSFKKPFDNSDNAGGDAPKRPYQERSSGKFEDRKERSSGFGDRRESGAGGRKPFDREKPRGESRDGADSKRSFSDRRSDSRDGGFKKPYSGRPDSRSGEGGPARRAESRDGAPKRPYSGRPDSAGSRGSDRDAPGSKRPYSARGESSREDRPRKEFSKPGRRDDKGSDKPKRAFTPRSEKPDRDGAEPRETPADFYKKKEHTYTEAENRYLEDDGGEWEVVDDNRKKKPFTEAAKYPMPLNKFIAHSGECSRRDAAELVKQGKAKVNGELITDPGHKVNADDKVTLSGKKLVPQKGMVYVLLNKPKGFITTTDDPQGRRTVMDLVKSADAGRMYPVGRLDRATTGLILLTNDGVLAQKLSHPSHKIKKVYQVTLDKQLTQPDFDKIMEGVELEDGKAVVDEMAYLENKNEIGLEIHSGKNRIVRRIFESLGYVVEKLDRVMYAGLTKKNLPRSKWRFLEEREVVLLKHFKS